LPDATGIFTARIAAKSDLLSVRDRWLTGQISSLTYLLILNFWSDRSFSTLAQYPVLPWVGFGRDLSLPMGQQTVERGCDFVDRYMTQTDRHFYPRLYSSPAVVCRFLGRLLPFAADDVDPFRSLPDEYLLASERDCENVEELPPEVFLFPELFGRSWDSQEELENAANLHDWIDLIFGSNSRGEGALESLNVFHPAHYGLPSRDFPSNSPDIFAFLRNSGSVPMQLFREPHPARVRQISQPESLLTARTVTSQQTAIYVEPMGTILLARNGFLVLADPRQIFTGLAHEDAFELADGLFRWRKVKICDSVSAALSFQDQFGVLACEAGFLAVFMAIPGHKYSHIASCVLPPEFIQNDPVTLCTVSGQLLIVCEVIGSRAFCFHLPTGTFIRAIEFRGDLANLEINHSDQLVVGIGVGFIEVFTVNGTPVASAAVEAEVTASSVSDSMPFVATGHANGLIGLWRISLREKEVTRVRTLALFDRIATIQLLRRGTAMFVLEAGEKATVYSCCCNQKPLFKAQAALTCGSCQQPGSLTCCSGCGLYFCKNCIVKKAEICLSCSDA
jgi:hypothetical protein